MSKRSNVLVTKPTSGAAAGGAPRFLRTTDWYNTSEENFTFISEETHMCYISTTDGLRDIVTINASPDPDAVFSKWLTEPITGPSVFGAGGSASNRVYTRDEVWMYLDQSKLPLVVSSFSSDAKQAFVSSGVVGNYADAGFSMPEVTRDGTPVLLPSGLPKMMTVVIYPCRFVRVALSPNCYGSVVGAVGNYADAQGRARCSATLIATFPKNYLDQFPAMTYLRMQKLVTVGKHGHYVDYIPASPIRGSPGSPATNAYGMVRYELTDLDPDTSYAAWVVDITAYASDSSTDRENKANLKTLVYDTVYFNALRSANAGNASCDMLETTKPVDLSESVLVDHEAETNAFDASKALFFWNANILAQPARLTMFETPPGPRSNKPITFIAGSCFAGTLDALKGAHDVPHMFNLMIGDKYYNDNSRGNFGDFIANYTGWLKNKHAQRTLISSALYTLSDDHENADNWFTNIAISRFNTSRYFLDNGAYFGPENTLYNQIMANPATAAQIMFRKSNQFAQTLSSSDRVRNARDANAMFWPTVPSTQSADDISENGCFVVRWGKLALIVLNSNADLNGDGSVNYHAVEGTLSADGATFTRPAVAGYHFIPPKSMAFLKKVLRPAANKGKDAAECFAVVFSGDVSFIFNNRYQFMREQFMATATTAIHSVDPNAPIPTAVVESLYEKLFNAYNYDSADGYHEELEDLVDWIKRKKVNNVFFFTGDPHSTLVRYLDKERVIVSACISSVSTYRARGYNLMLAPNLAHEDTIMAMSNNAYAGVCFDPEENTMAIDLRYGSEIRGTAKIPLKRKGNGASVDDTCTPSSSPSSGPPPSSSSFSLASLTSNFSGSAIPFSAWWGEPK